MAKRIYNRVTERHSACPEGALFTDKELGKFIKKHCPFMPGPKTEKAEVKTEDTYFWFGFRFSRY